MLVFWKIPFTSHYVAAVLKTYKKEEYFSISKYYIIFHLQIGQHNATAPTKSLFFTFRLKSKFGNM